MPTIGEMINKLLEQLKKDHDNETVQVLDKNKALFKDEYLDALIQTKGKTVDYDTAINAIHDITDLPIDSIQAQINQRITERLAAGLTLEQLTKATGKMEKIDPDTGDIVLDDNGKPVRIAKRVLSPSKAAKAILGALDLKLSELDKNDLPKIWNYDGCIWKPDGERKIRNAVYPVLGDLAYDKGYREMLHNVRARAEMVLFDQDPYLFPAQDGIIDLRTGAIKPHAPEDLFTFTYNAYCNHPRPDHDLFLWCLASMFPDIRDCLTAIDIITAVGVRIPFEVFIFLLGGGENGKGILEKLILSL